MREKDFCILSKAEFDTYLKYTTGMEINILTLFPNMFVGPFSDSIVKRASEKGLVDIKIYNIRDWALDAHKSVDGRPYGGGAGMVLRIDVIACALQAVLKTNKAKKGKSKIILLDATGKRYTQSDAIKYSKMDNITLIAGHYEGVDHRVHDHLVDEVVSIGDYVLSGGEIPAMVLVDSIVRLLPDAIDPESLKEESFSIIESKDNNQNYLEYPQYTRPEDYSGWKVPKVLLTGNHKDIESWRKDQSIKITNSLRQ
jgi:tRNA (guanine37-N1)-methyltransferase